MPLFTEHLIDTLHTNGPRIELWDTQAIGLGIRVTALGKKTWTYRYSYYGLSYRVSIGHYPELTLAQAREKAQAVRVTVLQGDPPHLVGEPPAASVIFADLAERFLRQHVFRKLAASTIKSYRWVIRGILVPAFGPMRVSEIEPRHVEDFHAAMTETPRTANLAASVLSKMMELAERWGYRERGSNPCLFLDRNIEEARDRHLSKEELARLWHTLDRVDEAQTESVWLTAAIRFAVLTGCRKTEIINLEWRDVDLEAHTFKLRKHKTVGVLGSVVKHLSKPAWDLLRNLPRKSGAALVFPGQRPGCKVHIDDGWYRIREMVGLKDVHFHDLRHTFGTLAGELNFSLHRIGGALNQTSLKTTQRYAHRVPVSVRQVVDGVGRAVLKATKG